MKKILQKKERVLRKIAKEVSIKEIKTPKIQKVLKEMSQALRSQYDGVAIAAPQIGYSLRIFIVSGKIFEEGFIENREERMLSQNNIITEKEIEKRIKNKKIWSLSIQKFPNSHVKKIGCQRDVCLSDGSMAKLFGPKKH